MTADARVALYGAPLAQFVAVRKELAAAAKAAGDKAGAAAIAKLARPTPAAWAVNQLWRHAGDAWAELARATAAIAAGDLTATGRQRAALATLRARAVELARACDQPASEAMLARLDTNLRALTAAGWGEVPPGQLVEDLEPPGFEAMAAFAGSLVDSGSPTSRAAAGTAAAAGTEAAAETEAETETETGTEAEAETEAESEAEAESAPRRGCPAPPPKPPWPLPPRPLAPPPPPPVGPASPPPAPRPPPPGPAWPRPPPR
jgi:hypothetical protein